MINLNSYHFKKFSKEERSTFSYWYYHWKAYNLVAMHLNCWKMKYIFHDFEKPWLKLFASYETVQRIHRRTNKHHLQYPDKNKIDWQAYSIVSRTKLRHRVYYWAMYLSPRLYHWFRRIA
jgi:hypothetical protein